MLSRVMISLSVALTLAACSAGPNATAERNDVAQVEADDSAMEAAKQEGRATLPRFFERLASPSANEDNFAVKLNLTPDGEAEFIWAGDLQRSGQGLSGTLSNDPIAEGFSLGQRVPIDESQVIDWGYMKDGVMQGHATTRVLLKQLPPEQAEQTRAALGW